MNTTSNTIPVVGYCRFSSDMQREESIDAQKQAIHMFIQTYNSTRKEDEQYELVEFYVDRAKSGKTSDRPEFLRMMQESKKKKFKAVIVHKLDRFSRNTVDTLTYKEDLNSRGIDLISAMERIAEGPAGTLTLSIMASVNTYYSQNLGLEVMKGELQNAKKCLFNGGIPCLGYDIVDKKYCINEDEAKIVRKIFELYSQGYGYGQIIEELNLLGYKTKAGNPFGKSSMYDILDNEKYRGLYVFNKIAKGTSQGKRNSHNYKPESEQIRIEGGVPRIVSDEMWDMVQALRSITHKGKSRSKYIYLLSGLVYCGECGSKMHGNCHYNGQGQNYYAYRCSDKHSKHICKNKEVRAEYLEHFVLDTLLGHFQNENIIPMMTKQLNQTIKGKCKNKDEEYIRHEGTLKMLQKSKKNLLDAIKEHGYSPSIGDALKDTESQIQKCEVLLEGYRRSHQVPTISEVEVEKTLENMKKDFKQQDRNKLQNFIRKYVERVTITETTVEVAFQAAFFYCDGEKRVTYHHYVTESVSNIKYLAQNQLYRHLSRCIPNLITCA